MLDLAINHVEELKVKFRETWFSDKYKFWAYGNYYEEFEMKESTWNGHQFVSLNIDGEVIGYVGYEIDRGNDFVEGLNIINFTDSKATFGLDIGKALTDVFEKFHFRKLSFCVVIGNPIERTYDRMIEKYHGRVVGLRKAHVKLYDGFYYDVKMYEILAEDYFKAVP